MTRKKILINKKIYPFETSEDKIEALDNVEYPYASGTQEWNGNKALLIANPTDIKQIDTNNGI